MDGDPEAVPRLVQGADDPERQIRPADPQRESPIGPRLLRGGEPEDLGMRDVDDRPGDRLARLVDDRPAEGRPWPVPDRLRLDGDLLRLLWLVDRTDGRHGDGRHRQDDRGRQGHPTIRPRHRRPPRVEDPCYSVFQSPVSLEQSDGGPGAAGAEGLGQVQERPGVAGRVAPAEHDVVARLLPRPRETAIQPVDQRVRPERQRREPLEQADEAVPP